MRCSAQWAIKNGAGGVSCGAGAVSDAAAWDARHTVWKVLGMVSGITLSAARGGVSGVVVAMASALRTWRVQSPHLRQGADLSEGGSANQGTRASAVH